MPSIAVKLHSVFFKIQMKQRLKTLHQASQLNPSTSKPFGVTSRSNETAATAANPSFSDGVATKDLHIDPFSSLSIRIFLPDTAAMRDSINSARPRRDKLGRNGGSEGSENGVHGGYSAVLGNGGSLCRKLPVILQFHGGGFVCGSCDSVANDSFCRRLTKLCDAIVIAVGYRLAPESRYPAAFEDGLKVLNWLGKQANLAECSRCLGDLRGGDGEAMRRFGVHHRPQIVDVFGSSMVEPWLAAHGDPSRCVILGVSSGANIADYVTRKAAEAGRLIDPVKVVAQVLVCPFFLGSVPTKSGIKLANTYFYDKAISMLSLKLFLSEEEFHLDHPAVNPLLQEREVPLRHMPPTLTVVAELDWMRDQAVAYSEELRKVNVDAPVLEYKNAVHEFVTLDVLLSAPQAQACSEDIALWVKKYISHRGHELSY